jgi:hypothetical protein
MGAKPTPTTAPKADNAPISAAKAAKPTKRAAAKAAIPESRKNAQGAPLRCEVMVNATTQCANPKRHQHGKAWTCSTHDRAIRAGRKLRFGGKATLVYVAPHAPVATK